MYIIAEHFCGIEFQDNFTGFSILLQVRRLMVKLKNRRDARSIMRLNLFLLPEVNVF